MQLFVQQQINKEKERKKWGKQAIFKHYSCFRVQYHEILSGRWVAAIIMNHFSFSYLHDDFFTDIEQVIKQLDQQQEISAVIITGEEKSLFPISIKAEDDLNIFLKQNLERMNQLFQFIEDLDKPVIAAIQRGAFGWALELLGVVDYVVSDPEAMLGISTLGLWTVPTAGGTQRLSRISQSKRGVYGLKKIIEVLVYQKMYTAKQGWEIGIIDELSPETDVFKFAVSLVKEFVVSGEGKIAREFVRRKAWRQDWERPKKLPVEITEAFQHLSGVKESVFNLIRFGYEHGWSQSLKREVNLLDRGNQVMERNAFIPDRFVDVVTEEDERELLKKGGLLPLGSPFYPRFTLIPEWQYSFHVKLDQSNQLRVMKQVLPVEKPKAYEVLLYMLVSEINERDLAQLRLNQKDELTHYGQVGLGLVVAVGEEVKREGLVNIGELVTVNLQMKPSLPAIPGLRFEEHTKKMAEGQGTHRQFAIAHLAQIQADNLLWEGYWNLRELFIYIFSNHDLKDELVVKIEEQDGDQVFILKHALPRLNVQNSQELFQFWTESE